MTKRQRIFAKVTKLKEHRLSALTEGGLYEVFPYVPVEGFEIRWDFVIFDDEGDKVPCLWEDDIEAEFECVYL